MPYECCCCGADISFKSPKSYWCNKCWHDWKESILKKEPWTTFLVRLESKRRYREKDMRKLGIIFEPLGDNDLAKIGNENKIIYKYEVE